MYLSICIPVYPSTDVSMHLRVSDPLNISIIQVTGRRKYNKIGVMQGRSYNVEVVE